MTIREQVADEMYNQAAQACINQHSRNIHTLYVMPDGRVYWSEASSEDVLAGTMDPVEMIYRTGMGSCGCNCHACMAGEYPGDWAMDFAEELVSDLIANVEAIDLGYFDDER